MKKSLSVDFNVLRSRVITPDDFTLTEDLMDYLLVHGLRAMGYSALTINPVASDFSLGSTILSNIVVDYLSGLLLGTPTTAKLEIFNAYPGRYEISVHY